MESIYFGENLKTLRESKDLKQVEMYDCIGFTQTTWNNYEKEKSFPKFEDFIKISKYFDITLDNLVFSRVEKGGNHKNVRVHKMYEKGGNYGGNVGGNSMVNEPQELYNTTQNTPTNTELVSAAFMNERLADKAATIAALNDTIKALKDTNATLNALIQEMGKDAQITSKRLAVG